MMMNEYDEILDAEVLDEDFIVPEGVIDVTSECYEFASKEEMDALKKRPSLRYLRKKAEVERRHNKTALRRVAEDLAGLALATLVVGIAKAKAAR